MNTVNIGTAINSAVQQAGDSAHLTAKIDFEADAVRLALEQFEQAAGAEVALADVIAELRADLDTIKAQIGKSAPSTTIIAEAGRSLRSVFEGVAGNVLTGPIVNAARQLWSVLGLN